MSKEQKQLLKVLKKVEKSCWQSLNKVIYLVQVKEVAFLNRTLKNLIRNYRIVPLASLFYHNSVKIPY